MYVYTHNLALYSYFPSPYIRRMNVNILVAYLYVKIFVLED